MAARNAAWAKEAKQGPRHALHMDARPPPSSIAIDELIEALCLFDEPMLNSRYHGMLLRRRDDDLHEQLAELPLLVLQGARLAREGAMAWGAKRKRVQEDRFIEWAEYTVLESFLTLAENQLRVISHIARSAPDLPSREPFDKMAATHRHIAGVLRTALKAQFAAAPGPPPAPRHVQEEEATGDFRGQLEGAMRAAEASGSGVRKILLSPTGLRHLRDQGCFRDGVPTFKDHSVAVDLGWKTPAFVIETYDQVPLEEIIR